MIRSIITIALIVLCGWLYWQNVTLQKDNAYLKVKLEAANKKLAHLHQKAPVVAEGVRLTPVETAQKHLEAAQDAFVRHDYGTALRQLDLADDAAGKAAKGATAETRRSAQAISSHLGALRKQVTSVAGPWIKAHEPAGH
jgi:hypothetical protein